MGLAGEIEARHRSRCLHIDDDSQQRYRQQDPSAPLAIPLLQATSRSLHTFAGACRRTESLETATCACRHGFPVRRPTCIVRTMSAFAHAALIRRGRLSPHWVRCPRCRDRFDVFGVPWCPCRSEHRTKSCPHCGECLCAEPEYQDPKCWVAPPDVFRRHGFESLLVYYI